MKSLVAFDALSPLAYGLRFEAEEFQREIVNCVVDNQRRKEMNLRKGYLPFVLGALILMPGCTRTLTRHVPRQSRAQDLREVNAELAGKTATLLFVDGKRAVKAKDVHIEPGAISYLDSKTDALKRTAAANIKKITIHDHKRGLKDGTKTGFKTWGVITLAVTALTLATVAGRNDKSNAGNEGGFGIGVVPIAAAVVAAPTLVISAASGAATGSKVVYVMGDKPNSKARRAGK